MNSEFRDSALRTPHSALLIKVEMGEGIVAEAPHTIISVGIGSCLAVTLYDLRRKVGGLAHIMLPEANAEFGMRNAELKTKDCALNITRPAFEGDSALRIRHSAFEYASTALPALLEEMRRLGCQRQNIIARIAGGARMFPSYTGSAGIGEQNIRSVIHSLQEHGIPLKGRDTGGGHGRSVEFHLETGRVVVKGFEKEDREI